MNKLKIFLYSLLLLIAHKSMGQTTLPDSTNTITITGIFDGEQTVVGNLNSVKAYRINNYYIAINDVSKKLLDSIKGKKIQVSGRIKIIEGKVWPARVSEDGITYEPYQEPDNVFICKPVFTILK